MINFCIISYFGFFLTGFCFSLRLRNRINHLLPDGRHKEYEGEQEAEGAEDDVAGGQEEIVSSQSICGGHNEEFRSIKKAHVELVVDFDRVVSFFEAIFDCAVYFLELRQSGCTHPDHEALWEREEGLGSWGSVGDLEGIL